MLNKYDRIVHRSVNAKYGRERKRERKREKERGRERKRERERERETVGERTTGRACQLVVPVDINTDFQINGCHIS